MNQNTVIYIILSAILLYLYYRKKDISIFVAFVVVAGATLLFGRSFTSEGFVEGNTSGGGVDKECAKLGFTAPKIQKKKWKESLVNSLKNIQKVAGKHWPFEDMGETKPKNDNAKKNFNKVASNDFIKSEGVKIKEGKENEELAIKFVGGAAGMYNTLIVEPSEENEKKLWKEITSDSVTKGIKGGEMYVKLLKKNHDNLKKDDADKDVLALSQYLVCLAKQWLLIFKQLKPALGSGDGGDDAGDDGEGDGEDEDKKKKKTKKKSKKDDDDE